MYPTISIVTKEFVCAAGFPETSLEKAQMNDLCDINFGGAANRDFMFDEYDRAYKYCTKLVAMIEEKIVGYARIIKYPDGPLPLQWNLDFEIPDELKIIPREETGEIDYLFLHPEVENPQIILLALLAAAIDSFRGQHIKGGYVITKAENKEELVFLNSCVLIEIKEFRKKLQERAALPQNPALFAFLTENLWKAIRQKAQDKGWKTVFAREVLSRPNVFSLL